MGLNENISGKIFIDKNENKINEKIKYSIDCHKSFFCIDVSSDI